MDRILKPKAKDLGVNPFTKKLIIPTNTIVFKNSYIKTKEGDYLTNTGEVESTSYTKLYLSSERRILVNNLSIRSKGLLLWILFELTSGEDQIWINKVRYMKENNISSINTYKEAIKELIRYEFIKPTEVRDIYWINVDFFFRGDRLKKYPNNTNKQDITGD